MMDPDSIVISGMSGRFPGCDNVEELQEALLNSVDLVSEEHGRWTKDFYGLSNRGGVMKDIDHFDAEFFKIPPRQVDGLDPRTRILLETTVEALIDAGVNPNDVRGSKTGVFVGITTPRGTDAVFDNKINFARLGRSPAMTSGMISFGLDLKGPNYPIDTACSSSLFAFCHAFRAIRSGECDAAIVCGATIVLDPYDSLEYKTMNILSPTGKCRFLDEDRDGFVKSESVVVTYLQKMKDARRVYATVKGCGTNSDGFKIDGVTKPSSEMQRVLMEDILKEFKIDPLDVTYIEAHGTGTQVGDLQETTAIAESLCIGRKEPLLIGSVKTNIGHTEMSSGLTSIIKVAMTMETGFIPPILHLKKIGEDLKAVHEGKLKPVTEVTSWKKGLVVVNSFGIGGTNASVVLEANNKEKVSNNADLKNELLLLSARNEKALENFMNLAKKNSNNSQLVAFLNRIFYKPIRNYDYRAYLHYNEGKLSENIAKVNNENRKVWFIYSGIGSQWPHMCRDLMQLEFFGESMRECAKPLVKFNINLIEIVTNGNSAVFKSVTNCFLAIVAVSISLTDLLRLLDIEPDGMIGHSVGEICCAYCDGLITKEEAMLIAHARGEALEKTKSIDGTLAVVGLTQEEITESLPDDLSIACYNCLDNFTISGPRNSIAKYVQKLKSIGKFAEVIDSANKAFHSHYISNAGDLLLKLLQDIIPEERFSSGKWISSSIPSEEDMKPDDSTNEKDGLINNTSLSSKDCEDNPKQDEEIAGEKTESKPKFKHSPEYHQNNLVNPVYFHSAMKAVHKDAVVIEISPKGLLQTIIKRNLGNDATVVSLSSDSSKNNYEYLIDSIGRLYLAGLNPNILKLNKVNEDLFPLSRGTPSLAPLIEWERKMTCKVPYYSPEKAFGENVAIDIRDPTMSFLEGHKVNDKLIYPVMGYAYVVWEVYARLNRKPINEVPIIIENMKIRRATMLPADDNIIFNVNIFTNGEFEVLEDSAIVCQGCIKSPEGIDKLFADLPDEYLRSEISPENCTLNQDDVYYLLNRLGFQYDNHFRGILQCRGSIGKLKWNNIWTPFLDTMIHYTAVTNTGKHFYLPESIGMLIIDPLAHLEIAAQSMNEIPIKYDKITNILQCGKVEIRNLQLIQIANRKSFVKPKLEKYQFIPYKCPKRVKMYECLHLTLQVVIENLSDFSSINILEIKENKEVVDEAATPETNEVSNEGIVEPEESLVTKTLKDLISEEMVIKVVHNQSESLTNVENLNGYDLVIINKDLEENMLESLKSNEKTFIFLKNNKHLVQYIDKHSYIIVCTFSTDEGSHSLIRLKHVIPNNSKIIRVTTKTFDWVNTLKDSVKNSDKTRIYLVSENEETCGIMGLYTCLRYEEGGTSVKIFFIPEKSSENFSLRSKYFKEQLEKDLSVNVYKKNAWGSYRFSTYKRIETVECEKCYAVSTAPGDFSKIKMLQKNPYYCSDPKKVVHVYYAGMNFKDVLIADGILKIPGLDQNISEIGYEYAGRTSDGKRVFGFTSKHAFGTELEPDFPPLDIPDDWSMEEAASVPIIYFTLIYAFYYKTTLEEGKSILIHSASGGVGMAAVRMALSKRCEIFATVGSDVKKEALLKEFPQLKEGNIFNSREMAFEVAISRKTGGRGVDYVLNSLVGNLFDASLRCVAPNGHFIEIGKTEFLTNSKIQSAAFLRSVSIHAISIDEILSKEHEQFLHRLMENMIPEVKGTVEPIPVRNVFRIEEIEEAFQFFQSTKHTGKIILKVRDEEHEKVTPPMPKKMKAIPILFLSPHKSYMIIGGLGGLGLELAIMMCLAGAKHIILNSRNPPKHGYQHHMIRIMEIWGTKITISSDDTSNLQSAEKLIKEAQNEAPLGGIFNLAMVNRDETMENQTVEIFEEVFRPKGLITQNIDQLTRKLCRQLDHFVVYSSATCGKGNLGQTNYGFANSTMERIIEKRNEDGLPGVAIQWGPIADVGYFARTSKKKEVGYFVAQPVISYYEVLHQFLLNSNGVFTSTLLFDVVHGIQMCDSLYESVLKYFGITNSEKLKEETTLMELGMDSLMGFEVKQYLSREHNIDISVKDLRNKTLKDIKEIDEKRKQQTPK